MKIFRNKSIISKLIMVLIVLVLFTAVVPSNMVYAKNDEPGGKLLKPLVNLLLFLGDAIVDIIHNAVYGMNMTILTINTDNSVWEVIAIAVAVIVAIALVIVVGYFTAGVAVPALMTALSNAGLAVAAGAAGLSAAAVGTILSVSVRCGCICGYVRTQQLL